MTFIIDPEDVVSFYDEEKGYVGDTTGEELAKEGPKWTGEVSVGDIVNTDDGEKRILELTRTGPDREGTIVKYKIVLGTFPKK